MEARLSDPVFLSELEFVSNRWNDWQLVDALECEQVVVEQVVTIERIDDPGSDR